MINTIPQTRGRDAHGAGYFGASRGSRTHNGVDFVCEPHEPVRCFKGGKVTKLGYPYSHDLSFRYVQVTDAQGKNCRYFYVSPTVELGDEVSAGDMLGTCQELPYEGIIQHYHFEIKYKGAYLDPIKFLSGDA